MLTYNSDILSVVFGMFLEYLHFFGCCLKYFIEFWEHKYILFSIKIYKRKNALLRDIPIKYVYWKQDVFYWENI